jgi:hypothetical protein
MKSAALILTLAICALAGGVARAQGPTTYLVCTTYSKQLGSTVEHTIAVRGADAWVDGIPYANEVDETWFELRGPTRVAGDIVNPSRRIEINRVTGEAVFFDGTKTNVLEWVRPGDPGCIRSARKF